MTLCISYSPYLVLAPEVGWEQGSNNARFMCTRLEIAAGFPLLKLVSNFSDRPCKDTRRTAAFTASSSSVFLTKQHRRYKAAGRSFRKRPSLHCLPLYTAFHSTPPSTLHRRGMVCCFVCMCFATVALPMHFF